LKSKDGFDKYAILLRPVATEKAMKKMEEENTMVFLCK
jgi:ribosomal protein L23